MSTSDPSLEAVPIPVMNEKSARISRILWSIAVVLTAVALAASIALLVDYLRPAPVFCGAEGGCGAVKSSPYASLRGIPTPAIGLGGMVILAILLLLDTPLLRTIFGAVATGGALFAGSLIYRQFQMHAFCIYCMTYDSSIIGLAVLGFLRLPSTEKATSGSEREKAKGKENANALVPTVAASPVSKRARLIAAVALVLAAGIPALVGNMLKAHVPGVVAEQLDKAPPGKVTIVDFVDFECPYCRMMNAVVEPMIASDREHVRIVRKQVPLTRIHKHALGAALASACADAQGDEAKADKMADALFTIPEENLDAPHFHDAAGVSGLDVAAFDKCVADPATASKIEAGFADFKAVAGRGLPLLYIGRTRLEGSQDDDAVKKALDQARAELGK